MDEARFRAAESELWASAGLSPEERSVRLERIGTSVRVLEVGDGEPVVFIHGGMNAGSTWAPMIEHLDGFRSILVDRPGAGLSPRFPMSPKELPAFGARFVGDVLTALGLEQGHVVASSFGGHIALRSAAAEPDRIGRMVQMSCPALSPGETFPPFLKAIRNPVLQKVILAAPPNRRAAHMIFRQMGHGRSLAGGVISDEFWEWSISHQRDTHGFRNEVEMLTPLIARQSPAGCRLDQTLLASVPTPTLFVWGADDGFGGPEVGRGIVETMPAADLVMLAGAGHLPWLDHPRYAAAATAAHLADREVAGVPLLDGVRLAT
jgi:pimeloyl-ACP methyl ester carboxylesterase